MKRLLALLPLVAACGATGAFGMSGEDNNPQAIANAIKAQRQIEPGKPMNQTGKAMAFLVTIGSAQSKKLIAWDLAAKKAKWEVQADVTSRVVVGAGFVAGREGKDTIVARSIDDGKVLWRAGIGGKRKFLGAAADGDRVFYVVQDDSGKGRTWHLVALAGGSEVWSTDAPGTLGAPAARGGLVFMPFLTQWLTILDARTGAAIARIRQEDEALNFVRTTSDGVTYGSKGVFRLDEASYAGTRGGATYGAAKLPPFVRAFYHYDAFSDVQATYSAYDRNRILWRLEPDEKIKFADGQAVVFTYRFFFAFGAEDGKLRWAHQHPRYDVVAADHTGKAIVFVSQEGELGVLDPKSGALLDSEKVGARILGATFDADGYRPKGEGTPPASAAVLAAIVRDRDARFNAVKLFAIESLGNLADKDVTDTLLGILRDPMTAKEIYNKAAEVLVARKDAEGLQVLIDALALKYDYLAGTAPRALDVIAKAIGAIGKPEAAPALLAHFSAPETPLPAVQAIATALAQCGNRAAVAPLRSYLLMYRADPLFASDVSALSAVIDALLVLGGGGERELVAYVASEPRTQPKVAEYAKRALSQTPTSPGGEGGQGTAAGGQ